MNEGNKSDEVNINLIHQAALKLGEAEEYQRSLDLLDYALQLEPGSAPTNVLMGLTYQSLGQIDNAEERFRKAVELDPENDEALQSLGLFLISNNRQEEGAGWLRKYIENGNWSDCENLQALVKVLGELDRRKEAKNILSKAWDTTRDPEVGRLFVKQLKTNNQLTEATSVMTRLVIYTNEPDDLFELAIIHWLQRQYQEAIQNLEIAFELEQEIKYAELSFTYEEFLDYEDTGSEWPIEKWPDDEKLLLYKYYISRCYIELGEGEKALQSIEDSMGIGWQDPYIYAVKTDALIMLERFDEALISVDRGIDLLTENYEVSWRVKFYRQKADVLNRTGNHEAALEVLAEGRKNYQDITLFIDAFIIFIEQNQGNAAKLLFEEDINKGIGNSIILENRWALYILYFNFPPYTENEQVPTNTLKIITQATPEIEVCHTINSILPNIIESQTLIEQILNAFIEKYPSNPCLSQTRAWLYLINGHLDKAENILLDALKFDHSNQDEIYIRNNLGYICILMGKTEEAESHFNRVLTTEKSDSKESLPGILLVTFYRDDEVQPDYLTLRRWITPDLAAHANLVTLALAQGDYGKAMEHIIAIMEQAPEISLGYELLGFLSLARGEKQAAISALQVAQCKIKDKDQQKTIQKLIEGIQG